VSLLKHNIAQRSLIPRLFHKPGTVRHYALSELHF